MVDCSAYVAEVIRFRKALNLTSIADAELFEQRFIRPSLALTKYLPAQGRLLDLGSGMGIPGVPILMASPGLQGLLVERRKKRAEFLRHLVRVLHLNAEVYDADIRQLPALSADACVARAVTGEAALLRMLAPHMVPGGMAVLPVPLSSKAAMPDGWALEKQAYVAVGGNETQLIRCYRFHGE